MDELNLGLLIIRLVIGVTLALHGIQKIRGGIDGTARWFDGEGLRPGTLHAWLAAGTEIGAGLAVAAGFLFPLSNAAMVGVMSVAAWVDHRDKGFFIIRQGWEYVFVLAAVAAGLAATGPGEWSVDELYDLRIDGWAGLAVAVGVGLGAAVALLVAFYRPSTSD